MMFELCTLELRKSGTVYWFYLNAESIRERVRNSLRQEVLRDSEYEVRIGEMATNVMCTCEWESGSLADSFSLLGPGSLYKVNKNLVN